MPKCNMTTEDSNKKSVTEFLGVEDYREFWKAVKEDLHARVLANN
jgi:hypothetical protein